MIAPYTRRKGLSPSLRGTRVVPAIRPRALRGLLHHEHSAASSSQFPLLTGAGIARLCQKLPTNGHYPTRADGPEQLG